MDVDNKFRETNVTINRIIINIKMILINNHKKGMINVIK